MASLRERRRADGTRAFAVLWRDPETGRQTSLTYDDEREAIVAKQLIEAAGGYAAEAARIADAIRKPGPTVAQVVAEHIDLLTAVGSDTRAHYRQQMAAHIVPTLGAFPVAALTYRQVAGWVATCRRRASRPRRSPTCTGSSPPRWPRPCGSGYRPDNPCAGVLLPKSQSTRDDMTVLTRDEFMLLLSKIPAHYQPLVLTLVATGLRWGEATALTAGDVDLVSAARRRSG